MNTHLRSPNASSSFPSLLSRTFADLSRKVRTQRKEQPVGARGCARLGCIMMDGGHSRVVCADDRLEADQIDGGGRVQG